MARIRTIKPEFWTSEQVADCSPTARLLFVGMWNFCDDFGVHPDSSKRLKMEVFPADDISISDVSELLNELVRARLVGRFTDGENQFLAVTGWHHQKIDKPARKFPEPPKSLNFDERSVPIRGAVAERSANDPGLVDDHLPAEGKGREGKGRDVRQVANATLSTSSTDSLEAVYAHYRTHHPRAYPSPRADSKESKLIKARLKEGYAVADLCEAIDGNHVDPHCCGQNESGKSYHSLELIMRNASQVEKYRSALGARDSPLFNQATRQTMAAGERFLERHRSDGQPK